MTQGQNTWVKYLALCHFITAQGKTYEDLAGQLPFQFAHLSGSYEFTKVIPLKYPAIAPGAIVLQAWWYHQ
jgi:hypothetical protein